MINRDLIKAYVYKYSDSTDDYGQLRQDLAKKRQNIEIMTRVYSHQNTGDMRYAEVELIGLTKETLTDKDVLEIDDNRYSILFFEPTKRWNQVFLKKLHD